MTTHQSDKTSSLAAIDKSVQRMFVGLGWLAGIVILFYFANAIMLIFGIGYKVDGLGQMGDYFGGMLNPVISGLALFWITMSVKYQKQELEETRKELKESREAQEAMAKAQEVQAKMLEDASLLSGLQTVIAAKTAMIESLERRATYLREQIISAGSGSASYDFCGDYAPRDKLVDIWKSTVHLRGNVQREQSIYIHQLNRMIQDRLPDTNDMNLNYDSRW